MISAWRAVNMKPSFDHQPVGPFLTQSRWVGACEATISSHADLTEALNEAPVPLVDVQMVIVDAVGMCVFGWDSRQSILDEYGSPQFFGVAASFDVLRGFGVDEGSVFGWEMSARMMQP